MSSLSRANTPPPPTVIVAGNAPDPNAKPLSPPIEVGANKPADGVGFQSVTPFEQFAPDRMQDVRSTVPEGLNLDKTLAVIRRQESGSFDGDYRAAGRPGRTASGAYQFTDGTWQELTKRHGVGTEYKRASDAPPEVQDGLMKAHVIDLYNKHGGDLDKIYNTHFTGNAAGRLSAAGRKANPGLTAGKYLNSIRSHEADYDRTGGKRLTAAVELMPE